MLKKAYARHAILVPAETPQEAAMRRDAEGFVAWSRTHRAKEAARQAEEESLILDAIDLKRAMHARGDE